MEDGSPSDYTLSEHDGRIISNRCTNDTQNEKLTKWLRGIMKLGGVG